ncbi:hypothetical protein KFZ67_17245 [Photobacterium damselae]|uniref:hypothetical protein n=1 Tax=Photobacterium damselae TaxID=38293 RepID=UPI002543E523
MFNWFKLKNKQEQEIIVTEFDGVNFQTQTGEPYIIDSKKDPQNLMNCYGYIDGVKTCTFEQLETKNNTLFVEHFALTSDMKGKKLGEKCLKSFALLLKEQNPNISQVQFSLYRARTNVQESPIELKRLRDARINLLNRINAENIEINHPRYDCYEVRGLWKKENW